MALSFSLTFTQNTDNIALAVVTNTTTYGTGGNQDRDEAAEFLLWSKTDKDGNRTFDNPDSGNKLTNLTYNVNTPKDGWYEGILERIQLYDAAANYVEEQSSGGVITQYASIFYYATTDRVYKAIQPSTGQTPTNTLYFSVVTDLSTIIDNTNIEVYIKDVYVRTRASRCASTLMGKLDDETCSNDKTQERNFAYYFTGLIDSADAEVSQENYEEMEKIMRQLETLCPS